MAGAYNSFGSVDHLVGTHRLARWVGEGLLEARSPFSIEVDRGAPIWLWGAKKYQKTYRVMYGGDVVVAEIRVHVHRSSSGATVTAEGIHRAKNAMACGTLRKVLEKRNVPTDITELIVGYCDTWRIP